MDDRVDGRAARWTGQQEKRRAEFVLAAVEAIRKHGADVSTEQIAAEAGVARTRLYRHFAGAADLNRSIAALAEERVVAGLAGAFDLSFSPQQIIRTAVSAHLTWLTEHHELYGYLMRHAAGGPDAADGGTTVADVKRLIADQLVRLLDEYAEVLGLDLGLVQPLSFGMVGFVDAAAARWVEDDRGTSLDEMVDLLSRWLWAVLDSTLRDRGIVLDPTTPLLAEETAG